jgi:hypothetical protein
MKSLFDVNSCFVFCWLLVVLYLFTSDSIAFFARMFFLFCLDETRRDETKEAEEFRVHRELCPVLLAVRDALFYLCLACRVRRVCNCVPVASAVIRVSHQSSAFDHGSERYCVKRTPPLS